MIIARNQDIKEGEQKKNKYLGTGAPTIKYRLGGGEKISDLWEYNYLAVYFDDIGSDVEEIEIPIATAERCLYGIWWSKNVTKETEVSDIWEWKNSLLDYWWFKNVSRGNLIIFSSTWACELFSGLNFMKNISGNRMTDESIMCSIEIKWIWTRYCILWVYIQQQKSEQKSQ